jgi:ribonuclease BN (tRNA processing enzyme)
MKKVRWYPHGFNNGVSWHISTGCHALLWHQSVIGCSTASSCTGCVAQALLASPSSSNRLARTFSYTFSSPSTSLLHSPCQPPSIMLPTLASTPLSHTHVWPQVTHVLATRVHTDTLAGLPGMLLSQVEPGADVGKPGGAAVTASVYGELLALLRHW